MATNINLLKNKKILSYPSDLGSSSSDAFGTDEQYVIFKINIDKKSTTLKGDSGISDVLVGDYTRAGILVGSAVRTTKVVTDSGEAVLSFIPKKDDADMRIRYDDASTDAQKFLVLKGMTALDRVIVLPMPRDHRVSTRVNYDEVNSNALTALGDYLNASPGSVAGGAIDKYKNKMFAGAASRVLSSDRGDVDYFRALLAEDRLAKNPMKEVLFKDFDFRRFEFSYEFSPKNEAESNSIKEIIESFRYYALPELDKGKMFYLMPAEFEIIFMQGQKDNPNIPKITTCVLSGVNVNYMPNNIWATLPNGAPLGITMTLEFKELELVDRLRVYNAKSPITSGY